MHRNVSARPDAPVSQTVEALVQQLIAKYPTGFLSEIEVGWPCAIAIRVPEGGCLDTPRAIIRGSYQEIRSFEVTYEKIKRANRPSQVLSSEGNAIYDVTANSCTCKGFHYRGHCKHVDAVREHMVAEA